MPGDLEFQIYDLDTYHAKVRGESRFTIQVFGRTETDEDVCLKITGFQPFFYVRLPARYDEPEVEELVTALKSKVAYTSSKRGMADCSDELVETRIVSRMRNDKFNNDKQSKFLEMVFQTETAMRIFAAALKYEVKVNRHEKRQFILYESNVEPLLRFVHITEISTTGWVTIDTSKAKKISKYSTCDHTYQIDWKQIRASDNQTRMARFKILGVDIECISCDEQFPQADRATDEIIQIGMTLYRYGSVVCEQPYILTQKACSPIKGAIVKCYDTERDLIRGWATMQKRIGPDFTLNYNGQGFDWRYIYDRIMLLDRLVSKRIGLPVELIPNRFLDEILGLLGKVNSDYLMRHEGLASPLSHYKIQNLSSSALGDNELHLFVTPGVVDIDMMKNIRRDHALESYKLDWTSSYFIKEGVTRLKVKRHSRRLNEVYLYTKNTKALERKAFIQVMVEHCYSTYPLKEDARFCVKAIETRGELQRITLHLDDELTDMIIAAKDAKDNKMFWAFAKDEMDHKQLKIDYREGDPDKIATIGRYCINDCKLPNLLAAKLETIVNLFSMAGVCSVPVAYIVRRGQGVKIYSLVAKACRKAGYLVKTHFKEETNGKYEGATVIRPKPGVYTDPVVTLDCASLYPNSMREKNLSHECRVIDNRYKRLDTHHYHQVVYHEKDANGNLLYNHDGSGKITTCTYAQQYVDEETILREMPILAEMAEKMGQAIKAAPKQEQQIRATWEKDIDKKRRTRFNTVDGKWVRYGVIPSILTDLLTKRAETNAQMRDEKDQFRKGLLNSWQLAYKVTANSLYGQTGATTSPIHCREIAASTTAIGRERLKMAKTIVEENFNAKVIYGDTDSIFIRFEIPDLKGKEQLKRAIELGNEAAALINHLFPSPQSIVYEKVFHPFILLTMKKYTGLKFEKDPEHGEVKSMGMVVKRRDNAPIVKIVVGSIINNILFKASIHDAITDTESILERMITGGYSLDKFVVSKALRSNYAKPHSIVHRRLADRMAIRDPGNKPQINDRIPFAYVHRPRPVKGKKVLQGDMVDTPEYIKQHNMKVDYTHYIEKQVRKPASQILELIVTPSRVKRFFDGISSKAEKIKLGFRSITDWVDKDTIKKKSRVDVMLSDKLDSKAAKASALPAGKKVDVKGRKITEWMKCELKPMVKKKRTQRAAGKKCSINKWCTGASGLDLDIGSESD